VALLANSTLIASFFINALLCSQIELVKPGGIVVLVLANILR